MILREKKKVQMPLYSKLIDKIIEMISTMEFSEKLPSERELCEIYKMSRTTVRQAMYELELNGYVTKIHGKGTFVAKPNDFKEDLSNYYSFSRQTLAMGKTPSARISEFHVEVANKYTQEKMQMEKGAKVIRFVRLRYADDVPMMLETTFIPYAKFSTLTKKHLLEKSLYDIFEEEYHKKIVKVVEQFSASNVTQKQAEALDIPSGSACLKIMRTSYDAKGNVVEVTHSLARSDQFVYKTQVSITR